MRSIARSLLVAAALLAPSLAQAQAKPTPIDQLQMTPIAASTCATGKSCVYWSSVDNKLHQRTSVGGDVVIGSGGGGGGGTGEASSFISSTGTTTPGDVWFDPDAGAFAGRWGDGTDYFARLGANNFTGQQALVAADVTSGTRSSPKLVLRGKFFAGGSSTPLDAALYVVPTSLSTYGLVLDLGTSSWRFGISPAGAAIVGPAGMPLTVASNGGDSSTAGMVFSVPPSYGSGVDAYQWLDRAGTNVLLSLRDDGTSGHYGQLVGLSSIPGLVPTAASNSGKFLKSDGSVWDGASAVTSVGLSLPAVFSVTTSTVSSSGVLTATLATQAANAVWAGPTSGAAAMPTFRALVLGDIPDLSSLHPLLASSYANPSWISSLAASKLTGQVAVANGGTGAATAAQNAIFGGPTSGSGAPAFRAMVLADVPDLSSLYQGADTDLAQLAAIAGQRGDVIYYGASGWTRLPKGTSGYVLTQGASDPSWQAAAGGGGAPSGSAGGDLSGTYPDPTVSKVEGYDFYGGGGAAADGDGWFYNLANGRFELAHTARCTSGQLIIGQGSNSPTCVNALAASKGGTALDTSASTGIPKIVSGTWSVIAAVTAALGGTGIDTSGSTGVATVSSGTWSIASLLGTTLGGTGLGSWTAGDLPYYATGTALSKLALGSAGRALAVNQGGTAPAWGHIVDVALSCTSSTTSGAAVDCDIITLPSGLGSSNTKSFKGTISARITTSGAGGGTVAFTCGTSHGGTDLVPSFTLTAGTTTAGTWIGDKSDGTESGAKADSARSYNIYVDGGSTLSCRMAAPAGTVSSALVAQLLVTGVTL